MLNEDQMPQRRADLTIDMVDGKIVVFSQKTKRSFIIGQAEYNVLLHMDGTNDYDKLAAYSEKYSVDQIGELISHFMRMGFVDGSGKTESAEKGLIKRKKLGIINGSKLISPDSIITKSAYFVLVYLSVPIFITGGLFYYRATNGFADVELRQVLTMSPLVHLISFIAVATLHEFSHAIIARENRIPVPEIGVMLYVFVPYVYTNLSYIRLLKSKWKRILCLLGGSMLNTLLTGCSFFAAVYTNGTVKQIMEEIAFMNLLLIISNLFVFFKLDGYFIMQEIIGESYLQEKSIGMVKNVVLSVPEKLRLRRENPKAYYRNASRRLDMFYFIYGLLCLGYIPIMLVSFIMNFTDFL